MTPDDDCLRVICTRRSVRRFSAGEVTDEDLGVIINAGLRAPSSKNSQPWHIAVARHAAKDLICDWAEENREGLATRPGKLLIDEPEARARNTTRQTLECVRTAPVLLLIFNRAPFTGGRERMEAAIRAGSRVNFENEYVGIGACMQNMLLAAHALGLGAVAVMDILPAAAEIRRRLSIDYDLVVGIALGHTEGAHPPRAVEPERFVRFLD